jgi:hypothetical protein
MTTNTRPKNWKRRYPWTPGEDEKTVGQSFAAIRSGILPVIEKDAEGECHYTFLDVFTKPGLKRYEAESRRAIQIETTSRPTKKGK